MKHLLFFVFSFYTFASFGQDSATTTSQSLGIPIITFDIDSIHLGTLKKGDQVPMEFPFTNTGDSDLIVEVVTSCKCTSINWPKEPLKPGDRGIISAIYDTENQRLGAVKKTLNVISNTDPMLVETKFTAKVVE